MKFAKLSDAAKSALKELFKSTPEIKDLFEDYHDIPSKEEITGGPAQAAHGANAERMIKEYSELAPQHGIAKEYDQVASLLSDFRAVTKSVLNGISDLRGDFAKWHNYQITGGRTLTQAEADLESALTSLGVATAKSDAVAKTTAEKRIALYKCEVEIQRLMAESKDVGADLMKRFQTLKSDVEVEAEVKQDKLAEAKAEQAGYMKAIADIEAELVAKGGKDEKREGTEEGNEAQREDSHEDGKEAMKSLIAKIKANESHGTDGKFAEGAAEKKEEDKEKEAMKAELVKLKARQDEIVKSLGDVSKTGGDAPKIPAGSIASVRETVIKAIESGSIPQEATAAAHSLLQQHDAVEAGRLAKDVFARRLELAPPSVKDLFSSSAVH